MERLFRFVVFLCCVSSAVFSNPAAEEDEQSCVIELSCAECVPDNMPLVTSHAPARSRIVAAHQDEVTLSCAGGRFLAYPLRETLTAVCERGRLRVRHDQRLRHLLELGCQEDVFEDVEHSVEWCGSGLQGRAYRTRGAGGAGAHGTRHVALLCFDADAALARWAHAANSPRNALPLPAHAERSGPLTLLGNFNHMFDAQTRAQAERLYTDPAHMTRRLREIIKHDGINLAGQQLTAGRLLSPAYFEDQNARVASFVSNNVAVWESVAAGNLQHLQTDVARALRKTRGRTEIDVFAGIHGAWHDVRLRGGRFPVPRYIWTVVLNRASNKALAVVVLNDPLVAVSEVRESVFCESLCSRVPWARELRHSRRWETPLLGLAFCCEVHNFTAIVDEMPKDALNNVPAGPAGLLLEL